MGDAIPHKNRNLRLAAHCFVNYKLSNHHCYISYRNERQVPVHLQLETAVGIHLVYLSFFFNATAVRHGVKIARWVYKNKHFSTGKLESSLYA